MTEAEIYESLTAIVRDVFLDDNIVVGSHTTSQDIEGWDSFNNINVIVGVEKRFKIKVLSSEVERLENVGELVQLIIAKTADR